MSDQHEELEHTLWAGLRALEEQAALRRRMAQHAEKVGRGANAREFDRLARDAETRAATLRRLLLRRDMQGEHGSRQPVSSEPNGTESVKAGGRNA
jgi:hypothetical protein